MPATTKRLNVRVIVFGAAVFAYFVIYPEDLAAILGPIEQISKLLKTVLEISLTLSPWLYGLATIGAVAWNADKITNWIRAMRASQPTGQPAGPSPEGTGAAAK